jgi:hypothetical protein
VALLETLGRPCAAAYADHLRAYEAAGPEGAAAPSAVFVGAAGVPPAPGLLRMALTAAKSAARFAGGGFRTVDAETLAARRGACAGCEYFTGLRCKVCGCFTETKARMPHERCPLGKWPS